MNKTNVFFIADDDPDDQEIFIKALEEVTESCKCFTAADGEDAFLKLSSEKVFLPDLIFLDLNMPKVNGKQCLVKIKQEQRLQHIPVIMYSTTAEKKEMQEALHLGAAYFLQKPNLFADLCKALDQLIWRDWKVNRDY